MSYVEQLEAAAMRLLDALGQEEAWNLWCADPIAGREPIVSFPEDFNEDSIGDEIREASFQLRSLVGHGRFHRKHPELCEAP